MNNIIYLIQYIPWINNNEGNPWKYIGSTINNLDNYFGSVTSKKWAKWWKNETKLNPTHFKKEIICNCISIERKDLLNLEEIIQKQYDVVNSKEYFNLAYATTGCFGISMSGEMNPNYGNKMSKEQKLNHSIIMKEITNRVEVKEKQSKIQKISQQRQDVKNAKSIKQKIAWKTSNSLKNSIKTQFKPTVVKFIDVWFTSVKNFKLFLKENGLRYYKDIKNSEYNTWKFQDYIVNINLKIKKGYIQ